MSFRFLKGLAFLCAITATPVFATPTFYTDEASFQTAAGGISNLSIDEFDGLSTSFSSLMYNGSVDGSPATGLNVTANSSAGNIVDDNSSTYCLSGSCLRATGGSGNQWDFTFDEGSVYAFGLWLGDFATVGQSTLTLLTDTGAISSYVFPNQSRGTDNFFGIVDSTTQFVKASLTASTSGDIIGFDNVQWGGTTSVPEPGTLLLLGLGIVGLALVRRKRSKSNS
ncbi:MAG: PEP-CTERM sorting domain-containing protein [Motiliproteus sp.]